MLFAAGFTNEIRFDQAVCFGLSFICQSVIYAL